LRFALESRQSIRVAGNCFGQELQRHVAAQLRVPRAVHSPIPPASGATISEGPTRTPADRVVDDKAGK
jgi:hypothetical protein